MSMLELKDKAHADDIKDQLRGTKQKKNLVRLR